MKAWKEMYESCELDEAVELAQNVEIKSNDGVQIVARVGEFEVTTLIEYNSPSYLSCSCHSQFPCKHEAALVYYFEKNSQMYFKNPNIEEMIDAASKDDLKEFLLTEFENNPDLKERFSDVFSIDKDYYQNRLSEIFKQGEGRDFSNHGFHELDFMEDALYEFISEDIHHVLNAGEYDFACDLMIEIAELLNDEVMAGYDSWYNLVDRFLEKVNVLSFCIYLDSDRLNELYGNMDVITNCF